MTKSSSVSRRKLLKIAGGAGAAATAGVAGARLFAPAIAGPAPKVRLAWTEVAACHSPLGFGVEKGFYAKQGVDVELFDQGASGQTLIQALQPDRARVRS
jgi:NitT/TauT family transport system substrate-binding protein